MRTSVNAIVTLQTMPMNLNLLTPSKEGSIASVTVQLIPLTDGEDTDVDTVDGKITDQCGWPTPGSSSYRYSSPSREMKVDE